MGWMVGCLVHGLSDQPVGLWVSCLVNGWVGCLGGQWVG